MKKILFSLIAFFLFFTVIVDFDYSNISLIALLFTTVYMLQYIVVFGIFNLIEKWELGKMVKGGILTVTLIIFVISVIYFHNFLQKKASLNFISPFVIISLLVAYYVKIVVKLFNLRI